MHIVIGKENGMIRIIGQGFTVYAKKASDVVSIIDHLSVRYIRFDNSANDDIQLKWEISSLLKAK